MRNSLTTAAALLSATACLAGCQSPAGTTAGKVGGDTIRVRLATIDEVNDNGEAYGPEAFVKALGDVSGGRIKVEVDDATYAEGSADAESRLVEAMAAGKLDGGWPSVRAFARAGIPGLDLVQAPFLLTNYAVVAQLVTSPTADSLLDRLHGTGIAGLALAVGPLRRPFAAGEPVLGPEDWAGKRVRSYNSPVQEDSIRALGATPVPSGFTGLGEKLASGELQVVETDLAQYHFNGMTTEAGNAPTNVVLWPKVWVLSLAQRLYDALTPQQRDWVDQAAEQARRASIEGPYDENGHALALCGVGVRFAPASTSQLADLHRAVQPVLAGLAADPLYDELEAIAARHPEPEPLDVPTSCAQGPHDPDAAPDVAASPSTASADSAPALPPDGTYRVAVTTADVARAGFGNGPGWSGTWTLQLRDGTVSLTCHPIADPGRDCGNADPAYTGPLEQGILIESGGVVTFRHPDKPVDDYDVSWQLQGDTITFTAVADSGSPGHMVINPWRRIGSSG